MRRQHNQDDDEVFDKRGLIRDGQRLRFPMFAMDSIQKAIARSNVRVTDGGGGTVGLHRPGFRIADEGKHQTSDVMRAYAEHEQYLNDAWKTLSFGGNSSSGQQGQREGDPCTKNGFPGVLRNGADGLYCDIGKHDAATGTEGYDHRQQAYDAYDAQVREAWRGQK